jgi:hypothetical protein
MHFFTLLVFPGDLFNRYYCRIPIPEWYRQFRDVLLWSLVDQLCVNIFRHWYIRTRVDGHMQVQTSAGWGFVLLGFRSESHESVSSEPEHWKCLHLIIPNWARWKITDEHKLRYVGSILVNDTKKNLLPSCPLYPDPCNGLSWPGRACTVSKISTLVST